MATLLNPFLRADDANGNPVSGGQLAVFEAGTTTPVTTYSDRALTTAQAQPLIANSAGEFAQSFVAAGIYKIRVSDVDGVTLYENDNVRIADRPDDPVFFDTIALLLASTDTYAAGTLLLTVKEGARYTALASGATNFSDTNAGGQKLMRGYRVYDTVADFLASVEPSRGVGSIWEAGGFRYEEAASGATDQHVTTAGGVKLYVLQFTFKSLGLTGVGIETTRYLAALAAIPDGAFVQADVDITVADTGVISASGVHVYGTATITQTGSNKKTINFTNAQDCTVTGVSFVGKGTEHDGANTSYNGVAAIFFTDAVNCTVDRVKVTNHAGGHIACSNPNGLTVKNSVITGIGAAGGISPLNNNADFAIGCFSTNPDNNITVEGCYISDCCFGIGAARGSGLIVRGNFFLNTPGQHHIYASAMSDMIVSDNYFGPCEGEAVKNQIAAASDVNTDNVVVANNVFKDTGLSCVAISWASGATVGRHKGVLVHGNVARGIGNYFAVIRRCDRGDVIDNVFEEISAAALDLQDWRGRVSGNKIRDGEWYAINATVNGDCEFSNNIIEDVALNSAGAATTLNNQVMAFISAFTGTGHLIEWRNNVMKMNSAPTNLIYSLRSAASVNIALDGGANLSGYPLLMLAATYNDGLHTPNVDNASTATLNPTVPIYGRGKRHLYGTQNPASASMTDTFRQGDVCWNTTPAASGKVGWVCVASGTPGTWKAFGAIDA